MLTGPRVVSGSWRSPPFPAVLSWDVRGWGGVLWGAVRIQVLERAGHQKDRRGHGVGGDWRREKDRGGRQEEGPKRGQAGTGRPRHTQGAQPEASPVRGPGLPASGSSGSARAASPGMA